MKAIAAFLLAIIAIQAPAQTPAALQQALTGYIWTWSTPASQTQVIFQQDGSLLTREKKLWKWQALDAQTVRVSLEGRAVDITFDAAFSQFKELKASGVPVTGVRAQALASSAAAPVAKVPPDPKNMTLAREWIPHNVHTRKVLLNSIESYSLAVIGQNRSGPEVTPKTLWGPITWLMPLGDALKTLPRDSRKQRDFKVTNLAFPQSSLQVTMMAVVGVEITDRCNTFKYISFICDMDSRVIGVQLMNPNPKLVNWHAPGPDGVREPYYNFIEDRYNGSTGNCVPYQVRDAGSGVKLIKLALFNQGSIGIPPYPPGNCPGFVRLHDYGARPYLESVHWYLAAPLAHRLMEIVDAVRKAGLDDK